MQIKNHQYWMAQAIRLAQKGMFTTSPNPRVGCVIVKNNELIGQGYHAYQGQAHAEINALNSLASPDLAKGSCVYVSLEPCAHTGKTPPCVNALIEAQVKQVVIAMQDPNPLVAGKSISLLQEHQIEVTQGILEAEAFVLNAGFIKRMSSGLPFVRLKMAISADGKTALKNGNSAWITGEPARHDVQLLRARACAVLTGINTVLQDDPSLNVRLTAQQLGIERVRQPIRVVLDSQLRLPLQAKMLDLDGDTWVFTVNSDAEKRQILEQQGVKVFLQSSDMKQLDLTQVLKTLAEQGINEIHTECGATLAGALLQQQLVDELYIYQAPKLLGHHAQGMVLWDELTQMDQALQLNLQNCSQIGEDLKLQYQPLYTSLD